MDVNNGFYDLCVNPKVFDKQILHCMLSRICQMGYKTVAINRTLEESIFEVEKKKKKKSGESELVKQSIVVPFDIADLIEEFKGKLRILSRITFVYSDREKTRILDLSPNLKKYDLYAVTPQSQTAFEFACSELNTDIITLNASCSELKLNRKLYIQAVERGIHFEIQYADLVNTATRVRAIHHARSFYTFGKSKNIIISSGAKDAIQIRNPYDIINLGSLLGLSELKAKASILWQCKCLILKAEGRRYGKAVFTIELTKKEHALEDSESNKYKRAKMIKL